MANKKESLLEKKVRTHIIVVDAIKYGHNKKYANDQSFYILEIIIALAPYGLTSHEN